jgi:hypothetical protein
MPTTRDGQLAATDALAELFRSQAALTAALLRWQAHWSSRSHPFPLSLQEVGLAVSFSRSSDGLYTATLLHTGGASLESGCCTTPLEAYLLVLGVLNPDRVPLP